MTRQDFLDNWLRGTTCFHEAKREIIWTSKCKKYIVAKHNGHSTYCGRALGTKYCEVVFELHDLKKDERSIFYLNGAIKTWNGKWSKAKQAEAEKIVEEIKNG